jgi:hypothetical protein
VISTEFGSLLSDDIKFKNINEMKRIRADLMLFHPIEKLARDTNAQFTTELLAQEIETTIGADPNNYCKLHNADKLVEFTARKIAVGDERVKLDEDIVVVESDSSGRQPPARFRPTKAALHIEGDKLAPTLTMDLNNVLEEESGDLKMRHIIRGLIRPSNTDVRERFGTENLLDAIRRASESPTLKKGPSGVLTNLEYLLDKEIQGTLLQIRAEIHSRLVFGVGCVPMILIGIGLGIVKRGGHLLTAFGASCIPAAVLIVCIIGGRQVAENTKSTVVSGMALMWGGLGFLLLLAAVIYHRLLKN